MYRTLTITPQETVAPRHADESELVLDAEWGPGGSPPPAHFHPTQDETFEIHEGRLVAKVDGEERELAAGDTLEIPHGTAHAMWNLDPAVPARGMWRGERPGRAAAGGGGGGAPPPG